MPQPKPLTKTEEEQIFKLHAEGWTRNAIAKEVGRSGSTISRLVAKAGLNFARGDEIKAATEAAKVDNAAKRQKIQADALDKALHMIGQITQPATLHSFGGADHSYNSKKLREPIPKEKRELAQGAATLITSAIRLAQVDADTTQGAVVDQWLAYMTGSSEEVKA